MMGGMNPRMNPGMMGMGNSGSMQGMSNLPIRAGGPGTVKLVCI